MGLKAGLHLLQQTGKAVVNYADDAARLVAKNGDDSVGIFCRKAKPINPTELKDLRFAQEAIGDTFATTRPKIYTELTKSDFVELVSKQPYIDELRSLYPDIGTYSGLFIGHSRNGFSGNQGVNTYLRTGEIPCPQHKKETLEEIIDSAHFAMQKSKLTKDAVLFRYVDRMDYLPEKGGVFTEKGFLSTGIDPSALYGYGDKLIIVKVPKDTPCLVDGNYSEVLLLDGLSYRVVNKSDSGAELICEKVRDLSESELTRVASYSQKVKLRSPEWVERYVEKNYYHWK